MSLSIWPFETAHPNPIQIVTGYFWERPNYSTWRTHGTNDYLLMLTLTGHGRIGFVAGSRSRERVTERGDLVLLRPGVRHDYGTASGATHWELLWAHFHPRPEWLDLLNWPDITPEMDGIGWLSLGTELDASITTALSRMHERAISGLQRRETFAMNALEEALLWCDQQNPRSREARTDSRILKATAFLRENRHLPITLERVAQEVGLSVSRFAHLFREQTGQTPQQFLERERMERAQQLLLVTSRPIADIALAVGFENPFYFSLRFKKYTGLSPRDYRLARTQASDHRSP